MIPLTKDKRMLGYEVLAPYPDISCFVTTRHGGCSTGSYASFNCTPYTGDNADCVRKNRELLCTALSVRRNDQQANMDGVVKPSRAWRRNQKKLRK